MTSRVIVTVLVCLFVAPVGWSRQPLADDRGASGLIQSVRRLQTTGRVVYMIAHPDDEDGGTVTMLSRGRGYTVTFLALSRGEAAGDALSSDFGPPLGIRRTLEMMRSSEYYGARLRMSRFLDFGLSRSLAKTLRYWNREDALRDMVHFIRQERPHVILSRWQGNPGDRLGNHEIDGLIAQEAFDAAGDKNRFPNQIAEGMAPWQPLKLYTDNRGENDDWTIKVDSAVYDPALGRTYGRVAHEGLSQQVSQAAAGPILPVGWPSVSYYKLVNSHVGMADKESDFFERIDVSLQAYPELQTTIAVVVANCKAPDSTTCVPSLTKALGTVRRMKSVQNDHFDLSIKEQQIQTALAQALGIEFEALVEPKNPTRTSGEYKAISTPVIFNAGNTFRVKTTFASANTNSVSVKEAKLLTPPGWRVSSLAAGRFNVTIPENAVPTSAFWVRDSIRDGSYRITRADLLGEPVTPAPVQAMLTYSVLGVEASVLTTVETSSISNSGIQLRHSVAVAPRVSVQFRPDMIAVPRGRSKYDVLVSVHNYVDGANEGSVALDLPSGWTAEQKSVNFAFQKYNEQAEIVFHVQAGQDLKVTDYRFGAVATSGGKAYRTSFVPVTESDFDTVYVEQPATLILRLVDVTLPRVRVGYIVGTGDDVPDSLRLLGLDVDCLDQSALAIGDLSRYNTIVMGVRAYLAREDLKMYNWRLLEYVKNGGVLVVQYNTEEFGDGYGPFPYAAAGAAQDVTEEDSPIEFLRPEHAVLNYPNKIVAQDFDGWLEKRGLRFLSSWDSRYTPVLSTHDHGQQPQAGGLLVGKYGNGLWVYNGYSLFRQLSFAVPGATRIFANLIALGDPQSPWRTR